MNIKELKLQNSTLGYTSTLTTLQAGKAEAFLSSLIRVDGVVMSEAELVLDYLINKKATPKIDPSYQTYNKRTGEMTKPKKQYELHYTKIKEGNEHNYFGIVNKTSYDFAMYLINNNLLTTEAIQSKLKEEKQAQLLEIEKEKQEMAKLQAEKDKQKQEEEDYKNWINEQIEAYNNPEKVELAHTIFKNELDDPNYPLFPVLKLLVAIENIGNTRCKQDLINRLHINNPASKKVFSHVTGISLPNTNKETEALLLKLTVNDFQSTKEYKPRKQYEKQEVNEEIFYTYNPSEKQFNPQKGIKIEKYGITMFLMQHEKGYTLYEARCGLALISNSKTKTELWEKLKSTIDRVGMDKVEQQVKNSIDTNGISPLYETVGIV